MCLGFNLSGLQSNLVFVCSFHFRIMEGGSSRQLIFPNSSTPTSVVLSGGSDTHVPPILAGTPSASQAPLQKRQWSNDAIRFLLEQCRAHVEMYHNVTLRQNQWKRMHELLVAKFPQESARKVKSLSDKWEKMCSAYSRQKKLMNQTGADARDDGAKWIWFDTMDEILSFSAKATSVLGAMDQGVPVPGTGTASQPVNLNEGGPSSPIPSPPHLAANASTCNVESTGSSPRTRAANLAGVRGKATSSTPSKRARVDRSLMETLDRLVDSIAEIERLRIEASLTMHRENQEERCIQRERDDEQRQRDQEATRKLELDLFQLQQASSERMTTLFADAVKKNAE